MHGNRPRSTLSARRLALLATMVTGFGAAALVFAPQADLIGTSAQAQNLTDKVQQLPQRPVGFADIVEKVKPSVISVRVKLERAANSGLTDHDPSEVHSPHDFERGWRATVPPGSHQWAW